MHFYDFGAKTNVLRYNRTEPPEYDFSKFDVPTHFYCGTKDHMVPVRDCMKQVRSVNGTLQSVYLKHRTIITFSSLISKVVF